MSNADMKHDDIHMLAGEYVLGLMSDDERAAFEALLANSEAARTALAQAQQRLLDLDVSAPASTVSSGMWEGIEQRITDRFGNVDNVVDFAARRRPTASPDIAPPMSRRGFWQGFAAASVLATLGGSYGLYTIAQQKPRMIVVLLDAQAQPVSLVETYEGQRIRVVPLTNIAVPEGKTLQVWTLASREQGPVSMGLMPAPSATTLIGPELPTPKLEQLYEITIEQAGGSPTGKPTGPIVGKGFAKLPQI